MTYEEAKKWLSKIGGQRVEIRNKYRRADAVRSSCPSSRRRGHVVQRHWLFDDTLEGRERELAIRKAFVRACEELRAALA